MGVGCDQLVERAVRAWDGQRWHGLSGIENVQGGVWVVPKLKWQPLHPRTPTTKSYRGSSSSLPASSSLSPSSWPSWQRRGFLLLVRPHPHLGLGGSLGAFCFSFGPIPILASVAVRGLSASLLAPSPPSSPFWPLWKLLSWIRNICFIYFGCFVSSECIIKHCLATSSAM